MRPIVAVLVLRRSQLANLDRSESKQAGLRTLWWVRGDGDSMSDELGAGVWFR